MSLFLKFIWFVSKCLQFEETLYFRCTLGVVPAAGLECNRFIQLHAKYALIRWLLSNSWRGLLPRFVLEPFQEGILRTLLVGLAVWPLYTFAWCHFDQRRAHLSLPVCLQYLMERSFHLLYVAEVERIDYLDFSEVLALFGFTGIPVGAVLTWRRS